MNRPDPSSAATAPAIPVVLRSWQHLRDTVPGLAVPEVLPLKASGTTFTMAQELTWLDAQHFAVGRWDGSLSIFRFTRSTTQGSLMSGVISMPSAEGVQMITLLGAGVFATSNDEKSALVWHAPDGNWEALKRRQELCYAPEMGVANCGVSLVDAAAGMQYFVIGHANGFLSIWRSPLHKEEGFVLTGSVDLRAANPTNPWQLHNIRGIAQLGTASTTGAAGLSVVTGSEDGDLCIVCVPDGQILARTVYNPLAQRGINSIALRGTSLLVANCAVGPQDRNLWLYDIHCNDDGHWQIGNTDSARLVVDQQLAQVFDFDVIWGRCNGNACWYAATEEGYLWMGGENAGKLNLIGRQAVTAKLGAAIGQSSNGDLALAAYDVHEFET